MRSIVKNDFPFYFPVSDEPAPKILFIQHYNLLCDERMAVWEEAIKKQTKPDDTVLDLGSGTGILSMIAARYAKKVWAVEIDPHLAEYSKHVIKQHGLDNKITVLNADARQVELPEKVDLLICEMLDTGLIKEQLIQVQNCILPKLTHKNTLMIPSRVFTYALLSFTDFNFSGYYLPLPHFETKEVRKTTEYFSAPALYHTVSMNRENSPHVNAKVSIPVIKTGIVNSIKIITETEVCQGSLCLPSSWFNPPLILPVEPVEVNQGDNITLKIAYTLGGGLKTLNYEAVK